MNITIDSKEFKKILAKFKKITPKKPHLPSLGMIKLETKEGNLNVFGTNLDVWAQATMSCTVNEAGGVCLNPYEMLTYLKDVKGNITLSLADVGRYKISNEGISFQVSAINTEDYPVMPVVHSTQQIVMPVVHSTQQIVLDSELLQDVFKKCCVHVKPKDRYDEPLGCIFLEIGTDFTQATATNTFRLFNMKRPITSQSNKIAMLIPPKRLYSLLDFIKENKQVTLQVDQENLCINFQSGDFVGGFRLVKGQYPNVQEVITSEIGQTIELDSKQLIQALKPMEFLGKEYLNNLGYVRFIFRDSIFSVEGWSYKDGNVSNTKIGIESKTEPFEFNINPVFVLQGLESLDSNKIILKIPKNEINSSRLFENEKGDLALIMTIRDLEEETPEETNEENVDEPEEESNEKSEIEN